MQIFGWGGGWTGQDCVFGHGICLPVEGATEDTPVSAMGVIQPIAVKMISLRGVL